MLLNLLRRNFTTKKLTFHAKDTKITKRFTVKPDLKSAKLKFGAVPTDYMVEILYQKDSGWHAPKIIPFQNLSIHPFNSTIHYALSAFEGLKAYRNGNDIRLFRPEKNMERFLESSKRLAFPTFDPKELLQVIEQYVMLEKDWIPQKSGQSLYIRPFLLSQTNLIGVHAPDDTAIYVVACPVGEYVPGEVKLKVNEEFWRGSPKSCAGYKLACNYAPTVQIGSEIEKKGYTQALWTYNNTFLESGASNIFFLLETPQKTLELVTHPLDGSILPGVTRDSILNLAPEVIPNLKVSERAFGFDEFIASFQNGTLKEVFVSGTAAIIGEVHQITMRDVDYNFKCNDSMLCLKLRQRLLDIQEGRISHHFSHLVKQPDQNK